MEIIEKGIRNDKVLTIDIGNDVRILNVLEPSTEGARMKYQLIASRVFKKCGLRPKIMYYPLPPEVARKKEMVPYFLVCLAMCREKNKTKDVQIVRNV